METSYFLAQLIGPTMTIIGLSLLFNGSFFKKMVTDFMKNGALIFISGYIALVAGIALVLNHNVWEGAWWVIFLSVLSWIIAIKGVLLFLAPEAMMNWAKAWIKRSDAWMPWVGVLYAALGVALSYYGFWA